jgi:16S rRNA (uracil1498-N3)-methyltransferase
MPDEFALPADELRKFRNVLRLGTGDLVVILPGDGRLIKCELKGTSVIPLEEVDPETESPRRVCIGLGMPRQEKLEESVRMGTEMGVAEFLVFPTERSVVKWDAAKLDSKLKRLQIIAREAAEVSYRTRLPRITPYPSLAKVLEARPEALVLSEVEGVSHRIEPSGNMTLLIGPEGGWAPREVALIGDRALTLGPRVLRVDTAVAAACALALLA